MESSGHTSALPERKLVTGVSDPGRLRAVSEAELHGHLGDENLQAIVATLSIACRVPMAVVNIVTPNLQTYAAEVGIGAACSFGPDELSFCAGVVETGRELVIGDARAHPVYARNSVVERGMIVSYAGVPLCDGGFVLGAVSIFDRVPRNFTEAELAVLRAQAHLASNVIALRRSSGTDILTGLPNRALCLDNLRRTLTRLARNERGIAVMFVDVDNFKEVNDRLGHAAGDQLLIRLAQSMTSVLRPTDTLARYGGDEFVVVCEDVVNLAEAHEIAERLLSSITDSVSTDSELLAGLPQAVAVSIGIAVTSDPDARAEDLITNADAAMYRAKYSKKGAGWKLESAIKTPAPALDRALPEPQVSTPAHELG